MKLCAKRAKMLWALEVLQTNRISKQKASESRCVDRNRNLEKTLWEGY